MPQSQWQKNPDFLQEIQEKVENFHKNKNAVAGKIREFIQNPQFAQVKPQKTGNSKVHRKRKWTHETFLQNQRQQFADNP